MEAIVAAVVIAASILIGVMVLASVLRRQGQNQGQQPEQQVQIVQTPPTGTTDGPATPELVNGFLGAINTPQTPTANIRMQGRMSSGPSGTYVFNSWDASTGPAAQSVSERSLIIDRDHVRDCDHRLESYGLVAINEKQARNDTVTQIPDPVEVAKVAEARATASDAKAKAEKARADAAEAQVTAAVAKLKALEDKAAKVAQDKAGKEKPSAKK